MNTAHAPIRLGRVSKLRPCPVLRSVPFKVFIGYADLPAVRIATGVIADAIRRHGRRFDIQPMLWRFDQLASDHWRAVAIRAATEADVIVLASSAPGALTPGVEGWVNAFLVANRGRPATLVAVAGPFEAWTISIEEPASSLAACETARIGFLAPAANLAILQAN